MVNFQGPIAKGKTGPDACRSTATASYDSRTIDAPSPSGDVSDAGRDAGRRVNFSAGVEHLLGAGNSQLRAEYSRRQNDRSNLGVGDFDLPERAYATDNSTDTFRAAQHQRHRQEGVQRAASSSSCRLDRDHVALDRPADDSRQRSVHRRRRRADGRSRTPARSSSRRTSTSSIGRKHSMRAGVLFEAGWWDSTQRSNANGTYTFTSLDAFNAGLPATYSDPHRRSAGRLLAVPRPAGSCRTTSVWRKKLQVSLGLRQEIQTQVDDKWNLAPRAAFTWNGRQEDDDARRLRHLLRLVRHRALYEQTIRVDGDAPGRRGDRQNPAFPVTDGGGTRLPASVIRVGVARPADHPAGVGRPRAAARGVGGLPHRLHVDARQQHAALGQRQRAGQRRAPGSAGRQHQRDSVDRRARVGSLHRRRSTRATSRAASSAW